MEYPKDFGAYLLPHHDVVNGKLVTVRAGVIAAGNALSGARGGVDIPAGDVAAVKSHIAKHYTQFNLKAPWKAALEEHAPAPNSDPEPQPEPVAPPPPNPPENNTMTQSSDATPSVARALGLPMGSTEADIVACATNNRELALQIVAVTGVTTSGEALGAMRGLKAKADRVESLEAEVNRLKAERDEQNFKALIMKGRSEPVKLTPAMSNMYEDRFKAALAEGRGAAVVEDLRGFLEVAPKIHALSGRQDPPRSQGGIGPLTYNGKAYADLKPIERARLKQSDPELFETMRQEAQASA